MDEIVSICPACGDPIDYCQGHGNIGDPWGHGVLARHDADNHASCHERSDCKQDIAPAKPPRYLLQPDPAHERYLTRRLKDICNEARGTRFGTLTIRMVVFVLIEERRERGILAADEVLYLIDQAIRLTDNQLYTMGEEG